MAENTEEAVEVEVVEVVHLISIASGPSSL